MTWPWPFSECCPSQIILFLLWNPQAKVLDSNKSGFERMQASLCTDTFLSPRMAPLALEVSGFLSQGAAPPYPVGYLREGCGVGEGGRSRPQAEGGSSGRLNPGHTCVHHRTHSLPKTLSSLKCVPDTSGTARPDETRSVSLLMEMTRGARRTVNRLADPWSTVTADCGTS